LKLNESGRKELAAVGGGLRGDAEVAAVFLAKVRGAAVLDVIGEKSFRIANFVAVELGTVPLIDRAEGFVPLSIEEV
jgi:hypothetical protein